MCYDRYHISIFLGWPCGLVDKEADPTWLTAGLKSQTQCHEKHACVCPESQQDGEVGKGLQCDQVPLRVTCSLSLSLYLSLLSVYALRQIPKKNFSNTFALSENACPAVSQYVSWACF